MAARIKKEAPLRRHFIAEWREARGLNRAELARAIGASKPTITTLEEHQTPYSQHTLELIADALDVHPAWLILAPPEQLSDAIIRTLQGTSIGTRFRGPRTKRRRA